MFGISAALTVPFYADYSIDFKRFESHILFSLATGCSSVTLFGTTGEGPSISYEARLSCLSYITKSVVDPNQIVLGLQGNAQDDIIIQVIAAQYLGIKRFLLPPPSFYGSFSEDGMFNWFSQIINITHSKPAKFYLYHIPQVCGVGISVSLVKRLKNAFPERIAGVKDSSGDFNNTKALLEMDNLEVLIGDERHLAHGAKLGAAGIISGLANLIPARLEQILLTGREDEEVCKLVDMVVSMPTIAAVKSLVAHKYSDNEWRRALPPLDMLDNKNYSRLVDFYKNNFASNKVLADLKEVANETA